MDDITRNTRPEGNLTVSSPGEPVIVLEGICKAYGNLPVLKGLDLQVNPGEVYGFLGRNGAGKSTTIRLLMGICSPDAGHIRLFGQRMTPRTVALRQRIGYVAQEQNFYPWMTPRRLARFLAGFYPRWDPARFAQLLQRFELPPSRRIGTFSGGMKAKLALSAAMAVRPEILLLDEPTAGMDPVARREFLDLVNEQAANGESCTFFSTHVIDDIEAAATRIGIIESGRAIYEGGLQPLQARMARYSVALADSAAAPLPFVEPGPGARLLQDIVRGDRRQLVLEFDHQAPAQVTLQPGWQREPMNLEDVFIACVAGSHQEHA